ncbi:hypothetical protein Tco_1502990 [Tanacetum coccineum]
MIPELGDPDREVPVAETFHEQTDDELTEKEEIWLHVQQMMKGSDIGIQEKKATLFNEWERFTSTDGESIESYYHRFSKLINDFKRNKHFLEKIASNLKFLNNLQPQWSRHVTIVHQTKDLHEVDFTQLYDFLKYNQVEVNQLRAERLARAHDPLALMANSNNPYNYPVFHQDQPPQITYMQQPQPNDNYLPQPSFNQNYMQQPMLNPEDISDPTTAMNMALEDCTARYEFGSRQTDVDGWRIANPNVNQNGNGNVVAARAEGYLEEIEEVSTNCILMANLQQASTSVSSVEQAIEVEKVNMVNRKMKETNVDLTTKLSRYKNQEKCFEINQEKYDKLERCYQNSVYQEQCLTKKINALHLSSAKTITTLNGEIANLNNQLSKEKSTVSCLQQEKKKLKSDFKTREDKLLDKQIQLENKIKELDNILVKMGQSIQMMHMLTPKPDSFYHTE